MSKNKQQLGNDPDFQRAKPRLTAIEQKYLRMITNRNVDMPTLRRCIHNLYKSAGIQTEPEIVVCDDMYVCRLLIEMLKDTEVTEHLQLSKPVEPPKSEYSTVYRWWNNIDSAISKEETRWWSNYYDKLPLPSTNRLPIWGIHNNIRTIVNNADKMNVHKNFLERFRENPDTGSWEFMPTILSTLPCSLENYFSSDAFFNYICSKSADTDFWLKIQWNYIGKAYDSSDKLDFVNYYNLFYYDYYKSKRWRQTRKVEVARNKVKDNLIELHQACSIFQSFLYENYVFIVKTPQITLDADRKDAIAFHDVEQPAIFFNEACNFCFINGRQVPGWVVKERDYEMLYYKFMAEKNENIRAAVVTVIKARHGTEGLLDFLKAEVVDEQTISHFDGYTETVSLLKTKERYSFLRDRMKQPYQPYCWSKIVCPSTGSTYLIDNSADFTDAVEALKWLRPSFVPDTMKYKWSFFAN